MITKKPRSGKIELDLTGPQGNAFVLLGVANQLGKQVGKDTLMLLYGKTIDEILEEMKSSDYENLVETLDKYFGEFLILYR